MKGYTWGNLLVFQVPQRSNLALLLQINAAIGFRSTDFCFNGVAFETSWSGRKRDGNILK